MNPLQQQQAVFKVGVVSEIDPATCTARVRFDDLDGLETMHLPVGMQKTLKDKSYWMPDVGEHVACLLDFNAEAGVILCAIYSEQDAPPVNDPDKKHVRFDDGTWVEYDRKTHRMKVECVGAIDIHAEGQIDIRSNSRINIYGAQHVDIQSESGTDTRIDVAGNAEIRTAGFAQYVTNGPMLVKSDTRLTLKGPTGRIDL